MSRMPTNELFATAPRPSAFVAYILDNFPFAKLREPCKLSPKVAAKLLVVATQIRGEMI